MLMGSENNSDKNNLPAVTDSGKGRKDAIDLEAEKKKSVSAIGIYYVPANPILIKKIKNL